MRYTSSILALLLGLGIYGVSPVLAGFGPFAATTAHADNGHGGNSGSGGSDDNNNSSDDDGTPDQGGGNDDDQPSAGNDDGTPDQGSGDNGLCVANCNDN